MEKRQMLLNPKKLDWEKRLKKRNQIKESAEIILTQEEFNKKYPVILKTKRFNDKGDELYIQEYYNNGKIKCFITKNKETSSTFLTLAQFDSALEEYSQSREEFRRIIPVKKSKQEEKELTQESQEMLDEMKEFETLGKDFLAELRIVLEREIKNEDWEGFSENDKKEIQKIATKAEIVKQIGKYARLIKKEDAEKVAKEIAEKII